MALHAFQALERTLAATLVLGDARRFLDEGAALLRLAGKDGVELALANDGVRLLAQTRVVQDVGDVKQAGRSTIYARYDWSDYVEKIVGYQASIDITLKELTIDQANSAIPAIAGIEDTTLDGTRFYVSTYDERYQEALVSALQVAQAKAQVLAQAAGAQLGAVANVCENYDSQEYRYSSVQAKSEAATMAVTEDAAADAGAGNSGDMLNPGEIEIKASISVTYELAS